MWGYIYEKQERLFRIFRAPPQAILISIMSNLVTFKQPDFSTYIQHVESIVRRKCQRCHSEYCTACGEPISTERTHRPGAAIDDNKLFHCSNLQGVILGVGLGILEQQFIEDAGSDTDNSGRTNKRRKTSPTAAEGTVLPSPMPMPMARGNKAKGGTGYAGDQKEDVSR